MRKQRGRRVSQEFVNLYKTFEKLEEGGQVGGGGAASSDLEDLEGSVVPCPCAMVGIMDHLVMKTMLMKQAQERRSKMRLTRQVMVTPVE